MLFILKSSSSTTGLIEFGHFPPSIGFLFLEKGEHILLALGGCYFTCENGLTFQVKLCTTYADCNIQNLDGETEIKIAHIVIFCLFVCYFDVAFLSFGSFKTIQRGTLFDELSRPPKWKMSNEAVTSRELGWARELL